MATRVERQPLGINFPFNKGFLKGLSYTVGIGLAASGIAYGVDKYIKSIDNGDVNPNQGITPIESGNNQVPSSEASLPGVIVDSPSPTSTPEVSPTPTSTPEPTPEIIETEVPDLTASYGLKYNLETQQYQTMDKRYGIEIGEKAGIYFDNVELEGKKVGGMVLVPEVAQIILEDELSKIPAGENKLKIIIPLDISELDNSEKINIFSARCTKNSTDCLIVNLKQTLAFMDTILNKNQFLTGNNSISLPFKRNDGTEFTLESLSMISPIVTYTEKLDKENISKHLLFFTEKESITFDPTKEFSFGEKMGMEIDSTLIIACGSTETVSLKPSDLLSIEGNLVFISPNIPKEDK